MTTAPEPTLRPITVADRSALGRFSCRNWSEPWTAEVERTVHCLADELELSAAIDAQGLWAGEDIVALVVWRMIPTTTLCQSLVLAVETGHRRLGYGRRLKAVELDTARATGCRAVISKVHWNNAAMLGLNDSFGANIERIEGDLDYALCIISIKRT